MSKPALREKPRIRLKTSLAKAVELIAANKVLSQKEGRKYWIFETDKGAAKLLLAIVANNANEGWAVLYGLDSMRLYGEQIRDIFNYFCQGDIDIFVRCAKGQDERMVNWIRQDGQRTPPA